MKLPDLSRVDDAGVIEYHGHPDTVAAAASHAKLRYLNVDLAHAEDKPTLFHELAHWSESRLNWKGDYPSGELRAEIAAAFVSAELGVPQSDDLTNVNAYLKSWLRSLKDDPRYIFTSSAAASKAADYVLSFSRTPEAVEEPAEALSV